MRKIAAVAAALMALAADPGAARAAPALTCTSDGMLCYSVSVPVWTHPSVTTVSLGDAKGTDGPVSTGYQWLQLGPAEGGLDLYTYGNAGIYHGSSSVATAPGMPGGAGNYLAIPTSGGNMDAVFDASQMYVSFLWGAPKNGNVATFYSGYETLGSVSGASVRAAAGSDPGYQGSYLVTFRPGENALQAGMGITEAYFQSTSGQDFSIASLSYSPEGGSPVGPAPLPALGGTVPGVMAVLGMMGLRRRRSRGASAA